MPWKNSWMRKRNFAFKVEGLQDDIASLKTTYEFFSYFVTPDLLITIAEESKTYLLQCNPNATQTITETDIKRFLGVCFLLSLAPPHDIRKGWSKVLRNKIVCETLSLNKFEFVRQNIHFSNNENMVLRGNEGYDRLFKLRPVIKALQDKFRSVPFEEILCVDEQMCPTKARSYLKMYMPKYLTSGGISCLFSVV